MSPITSSDPAFKEQYSLRGVLNEESTQQFAEAIDTVCKEGRGLQLVDFLMQEIRSVAEDHNEKAKEEAREEEKESPIIVPDSLEQLIKELSFEASQETFKEIAMYLRSTLGYLKVDRNPPLPPNTELARLVFNLYFQHLFEKPDLDESRREILKQMITYCDEYCTSNITKATRQLTQVNDHAELFNQFAPHFYHYLSDTNCMRLLSRTNPTVQALGNNSPDTIWDGCISSSGLADLTCRINEFLCHNYERTHTYLFPSYHTIRSLSRLNGYLHRHAYDHILGWEPIAGSNLSELLLPLADLILEDEALRESDSGKRILSDLYKVFMKFLKVSRENRYRMPQYLRDDAYLFARKSRDILKALSTHYYQD